MTRLDLLRVPSPDALYLGSGQSDVEESANRHNLFESLDALVRQLRELEARLDALEAGGKPRTVTATETLDPGDRAILVDGSGGAAIALTLPSPEPFFVPGDPNPPVLRIKYKPAGTSAVTVVSASGHTLEDVTTAITLYPGDSLTLVAHSKTAWYA